MASPAIQKETHLSGSPPPTPLPANPNELSSTPISPPEEASSSSATNTASGMKPPSPVRAVSDSATDTTMTKRESRLFSPKTLFSPLNRARSSSDGVAEPPAPPSAVALASPNRFGNLVKLHFTIALLQTFVYHY